MAMAMHVWVHVWVMAMAMCGFMAMCARHGG